MTVDIHIAQLCLSCLPNAYRYDVSVGVKDGVGDGLTGFSMFHPLLLNGVPYLWTTSRVWGLEAIFHIYKFRVPTQQFLV